MSDRKWLILFVVLSVLIGTASSLLLTVAYAGRPQPAAVELVDLNYEPGEYCPGDTVPFEITWQINREAILLITSSHMRGIGADGDTAIPGRMPSAALVTNPTPRLLYDTDPKFTIPDLPPGEYARVLAIGTLSEDSEPAIVLFPYTIRDDCN